MILVIIELKFDHQDTSNNKRISNENKGNTFNPFYSA